MAGFVKIRDVIIISGAVAISNSGSVDWSSVGKDVA
jgi:hypothetical protein